jgi:ketosteroid isomerase-like protein
MAAFRRGDIEAVLDLNHPDAEWVNPDYAVETGTRRGREEVRLALEQVADFFGEVELEEMVRAPHGRVLIIATVRSLGAASSVGMEARTAALFTLRDGLIVRYEWFRTPEEGRAAAGLD